MPKTDLTQIEAQLAERAKNLQSQLGSLDTRRITVSQKDGQLIGPGGLALGDEVRVIVVEFCTVNKYFDRPYDENKPMPPACVAVGQDLAELRPEDGVPAPQSDLCSTCWANKWESDAKQKGKACKNTRELAVVLYDELEDPDYEPELFIVSCSPTSIKSFDAAATKINQLFNGPPIKAVMTMTAVATNNYYNLRFGQIDAHPYLERVFPMIDDALALLGTLPDFTNYEPPKHLPGDDVRKRAA